MDQILIPTAIDLFAGAGGLSLGLQQSGFRVLVAIESWKAAASTYRANFDHPVLEQSVEKTTGSELLRAAKHNSRVDIVVGGPPCQGFSIQRIGEDTDHRNLLIFEFHRIVCELEPRMFMMENVTGLLGRRGRPHFEELVGRFTRAGYDYCLCRVDAADFGVPQHRRRVLLFGWRPDELGAFSLDAPARRSPRSVQDAIGDLQEPPLDHTPLPGDPLHRRTKMSPLNLRRMSLIPEGGGFEDLPIDLRVNCHKNGAAKIGHRNVYGRLAFDKPAVTITARFDSFTRGKFGHPVQDRNITLREGARLQTFPDSFQFEGSQEDIAAQIGNAVPVALGQFVGKSMLQHLAKEKATPDQLPLFVNSC